MVSAEPSVEKWKMITGKVIIAFLAIGFLISAYQKYSSSKGDYYPRHDLSLNKSVEWIQKNTGKDDTFMALTADEKDLALIMQIRPVYLGYIGHLSHLGLPWETRYNATLQFFQSGIAPENVDYAFYGPVEKKYFPNAGAVLSKYPIAYQDSAVTIFRLH